MKVFDILNAGSLIIFRIAPCSVYTFEDSLFRVDKLVKSDEFDEKYLKR